MTSRKIFTGIILNSKVCKGPHLYPVQSFYGWVSWSDLKPDLAQSPQSLKLVNTGSCTNFSRGLNGLVYVTS